MISIGKYVNTHGIKGEIRILSDFSRKDLVFTKGFKIYMNNNEYVVNSYRKHKNYDMVTLDGISNINDIIDLKGSIVYIKREDLNEFIDEDLYRFSVIYNNNSYKIKDIIVNKSHKILVLENNKMVPYVSDFIISINKDEKKIYMDLPDNLI